MFEKKKKTEKDFSNLFYPFSFTLVHFFLFYFCRVGKSLDIRFTFVPLPTPFVATSLRGKQPETELLNLHMFGSLHANTIQLIKFETVTYSVDFIKIRNLNCNL